MNAKEFELSDYSRRLLHIYCSLDLLGEMINSSNNVNMPKADLQAAVDHLRSSWELFAKHFTPDNYNPLL